MLNLSDDDFDFKDLGRQDSVSNLVSSPNKNAKQRDYNMVYQQGQALHLQYIQEADLISKIATVPIRKASTIVAQESMDLSNTDTKMQVVPPVPLPKRAIQMQRENR